MNIRLLKKIRKDYDIKWIVQEPFDEEIRLINHKTKSILYFTGTNDFGNFLAITQGGCCTEVNRDRKRRKGHHLTKYYNAINGSK